MSKKLNKLQELANYNPASGLPPPNSWTDEEIISFHAAVRQFIEDLFCIDPSSNHRRSQIVTDLTTRAIEFAGIPVSVPFNTVHDVYTKEKTNEDEETDENKETVDGQLSDTENEVEELPKDTKSNFVPLELGNGIEYLLEDEFDVEDGTILATRRKCPEKLTKESLKDKKLNSDRTSKDLNSPSTSKDLNSPSTSKDLNSGETSKKCEKLASNCTTNGAKLKVSRKYIDRSKKDKNSEGMAKGAVAKNVKKKEKVKTRKSKKDVRMPQIILKLKCNCMFEDSIKNDQENLDSDDTTEDIITPKDSKKDNTTKVVKSKVSQEETDEFQTDSNDTTTKGIQFQVSRIDIEGSLKDKKLESDSTIIEIKFKGSQIGAECLTKNKALASNCKTKGNQFMDSNNNSEDLKKNIKFDSDDSTKRVRFQEEGLKTNENPLNSIKNTDDTKINETLKYDDENKINKFSQKNKTLASNNITTDDEGLNNVKCETDFTSKGAIPKRSKKIASRLKPADDNDTGCVSHGILRNSRADTNWFKKDEKYEFGCVSRGAIPKTTRIGNSNYKYGYMNRLNEGYEIASTSRGPSSNYSKIATVCTNKRAIIQNLKKGIKELIRAENCECNCVSQVKIFKNLKQDAKEFKSDEKREIDPKSKEHVPKATKECPEEIKSDDNCDSDCTSTEEIPEDSKVDEEKEEDSELINCDEETALKNSKQDAEEIMSDDKYESDCTSKIDTNDNSKNYTGILGDDNCESDDCSSIGNLFESSKKDGESSKTDKEPELFHDKTNSKCNDLLVQTSCKDTSTNVSEKKKKRRHRRRSKKGTH